MKYILGIAGCIVGSLIAMLTIGTITGGQIFPATWYFFACWGLILGSIIAFELAKQKSMKPLESTIIGVAFVAIVSIGVYVATMFFHSHSYKASLLDIVMLCIMLGFIGALGGLTYGIVANYIAPLLVKDWNNEN